MLQARERREPLVPEPIDFNVHIIVSAPIRAAPQFSWRKWQTQYPVEVIATARNLNGWFHGLLVVGNDVYVLADIRRGSIVIETMTWSGD